MVGMAGILAGIAGEIANEQMDGMNGIMGARINDNGEPR